MKTMVMTAAVFALSSPIAVHAGTLAEGQWTAPACGTEPKAVSLDLSSVEAFNRSVPEVKTWQDKANAYVSCLIREANADNGVIVKAVNEAQARVKAGFDKVKADGAKAHDKFNGDKGKAQSDSDMDNQSTVPATPNIGIPHPPAGK